MKVQWSLSRIKNLLSVVFGMLFLFAVSAHAHDESDPRVWIVPGEEFQTIQDAFNSDDLKDGDRIVVKDGSYSGEGFVNIDFGGKAVTVESENGADKCILDGGGANRFFYFHSKEGKESVVSGFTLTNGSAEYGGAIAIEKGSSPTIKNCSILKNTATVRGGGISIDDSSPVIVNCVLAGNTAPLTGNGGAISCSGASPIITNTTITGNQAGTSGGAIYCANASAPVITNSILWGNTAGDSAVALGDEIAVPDGDAGAPVVTYSDVQGSYIGTGNLDVDPRFVDASIGDYHLVGTGDTPSLCIDVGNNAAPEIPATDKDGYNRIMNSVVDLGAYEFNPYGPIVPEFGGTPLEGVAPLLVTFTDQSTCTLPSGWLWDFGDGETSTDQNPTHLYDHHGTYSVSLTVTGAAGSRSTMKEDYVKVKKPVPVPVASFTAKPTSGKAPLRVHFHDTSKNRVTQWKWDFGDGKTSTQKEPHHTYTAPGTFTVKLEVTGPGGTASATREALIKVEDAEAAPVAGFTAEPTSGKAPLRVSFHDTSTNKVTRWNWDFGDGRSSRDKDPHHTYVKAGTYTVTLEVTGPGGTSTKVEKDLITVTEPPPVAHFRAEPLKGKAPLKVKFRGSSEGKVESWLWDFGDGTTSPEQSPTHTYVASGKYTVTLTVTGPGGSDTETKTDYINVAGSSLTADFSARNVSGKAPLWVKFTAKAERGVKEYLWDFGDQTPLVKTRDHSISHIYKNAGSYSVSLTVTTSGGGTATVLKENYITVQ